MVRIVVILATIMVTTILIGFVRNGLYLITWLIFLATLVVITIWAIYTINCVDESQSMIEVRQCVESFLKF